jgi:hypothetical protein
VNAEKLFRVASTTIVVAALLFQSAAIDATTAVAATAGATQSRKATTRKKAGMPASAVKGSSKQPTPATAEATPATAAPTPAPAKANNREVPPPVSPPAKTNTEVTKANDPSATAVRYSYEFKQPEFIVSRILVEHDATGRGQVSFVRKGSTELFTDPIEISPAALARITAAWEALKFLDSDANYQAEKQFPHLGTMTLRMKQGTRERTAEFNWTHDEGVAALVKEYRGIGEQQLFIFDVSVARQYQPSDTIKIIKRLEILLDRKELSDTAQLVPFLNDLSTDERIPLMARNHVTRLLKKIEKLN